MSHLAFEICVVLPEDSTAWTDLIPELPQRATLLEASMHIEPTKQYALLTYRGAQPRRVTAEDGSAEIQYEPHQRRSQQRVPLSMAQAQALLTKAYPANKRAEVLSSVITTSEVDVSSTSPDASIKGFVSTTGKKHLIGEVSAENSYVRTECSSSFSHGQTAVFAVRDLTCAKCRKAAGLDA